ncbi:TPA: hypothetical protein RTF98_001163 [Campylobacter jejuni]|nr:hypothetical protein [Campylobacter jejuni]HDZ4976000.1 hypothetical protein [Campylobacter jejuni]HDZ5002051.1 hypothetical protein [Campylobacter jejuni]HDZ5013911.1 hypothetical protein [Campylobacter jejuni]HDZ5020885.1 hypothetical protein [Campylobacter jejuni]
MEYKKALFYIFAIIHLFFWIIFLPLNHFQLNAFLSYEIAFFSVLLIVFTSYLNYKKVIIKKSKNYKEDFNFVPLIFIKKKQNLPKIIHFKVAKDDLRLNIKEKIHFFAMFFTLFKLMAYVVLVAGFLFLHRQDKLDIFAYICGISSLLVCVFVFILYIKKYESKKNY